MKINIIIHTDNSFSVCAYVSESMRKKCGSYQWYVLDKPHANNKEYLSGEVDSKITLKHELLKIYHGKWLCCHCKITEVQEYHHIVEDLRRSLCMIQECDLSINKKMTAAKNVKTILTKCLLDENLDHLTITYRDKDEDNILGYDARAVSTFLEQLYTNCPIPRPLDMTYEEGCIYISDDLIEMLKRMQTDVIYFSNKRGELEDSKYTKMELKE